MLSTAGINLAGLDEWHIQFSASATVPSSGCGSSSSEGTHNIYWTRAYGNEPILSFSIDSSVVWEPEVITGYPIEQQSPNISGPILNSYLEDVQPDENGMVSIPLSIDYF